MLNSDSPLYLTGFRATGKTSVAQVLGERRELSVIDLDSEICQIAGKTISEIFRDQGQERFREMETEQISRVATQSGIIVSLGGGAVLKPENRQLIADSGPCVWLDADVQVIVDRLVSDPATQHQRPGLTELSVADEVRQLLADRRPLYEKASDYRVDTTGKSLDQVADEILAWLDQYRSVAKGLGNGNL